MAVSANFVHSLYVAYFGRAADPAGVAYWTTVNADQLTIAKSFSDQVESQGAFALLKNPELVTESSAREGFLNAIYENLFNRSADAADLAYWSPILLAKGKDAVGEIIIQIVEGALNDDAKTVANKVAASQYYAEQMNLNNVSFDYTADSDADGILDFAEGSAADALANIDATDASLTAAKAAIDNTVSGSVNPGQTFTLTTGTDSGTAFTGTTGNDTFTSNVAVVIDPATGTQNNVDTIQAVDSLVGGAGTDTLNFVSKGGTVNLASMSGIEVMNGQSLGALTVNASAVSDLTNLNVTKAADAVDVTASATADVSVSMKAAGAAVDVAGGKNVTVNLTDVAGSADVVSVGVAADADAAGDVAVTMTGKAYTAATANTTLSAVNVTGGKTITVTQKAAADSSAAAADTANTTITQGAVAITGNADTTAVTVKQDASVTADNADYKTGGVTETVSVKFGALKDGDVLAVNGLTFTAAADMTAAEVASAFANLLNGAAYAAPASILAGDTQASGSAAKGTYTLVSAGGATGWTSGAASSDTVVFTYNTANADAGAALAIVLTNTSGSSVAPIPTVTEGKAHDAGAADGKMGVATGTVSVTDANATIKTITIDGYKTGSSTTSTSVLETLNLSNSDAAATITVADTAATLALNLEKVDGAVSFTAAPTTLNVKSTGANSATLTAAATTALNVTGTGVLTTGASDLSGVKTVVVSETAGLNLTGATLTVLESINSTATTGAVTASISGTQTTYTGGAGVDTVTITSAGAQSKAIDLGAGDDTLVFGAAVTSSTAAVAGGAGTDTLSMTVANADALDAVAQSFYTGFERLTLNDAAGDGVADAIAEDVTIDLSKLGLTNYVTTTGSDEDTLILDKLTSNGTVVLTAGGLITVNVADAATGTADVLNAVLSSVNALAAGTLTAADVETINISTVDTEVVVAPAVQTKNVDTLTLTADKATTVNVSGAQDLNLTLTDSTKVTTIDASSMTGNLTVTSLNTTSATTIKGGSGNDVLTAATGTTADVLLGGAGNDVLVANAGLNTLTGGEGNDVFVIGTASLNSSSYATITDFAAGDLVKFTGADSFAASKVVQADTAVFQDYVNAAMNATGQNDVSWFQYAGNTYLVMDAGANSTTFTNGEDFVVKLTGLVDLSNASFNDTSDTIAL